MHKEIENELKKKDNIVFGPFIGELGWEILRWSGFVRWYKKTNPEKNIVVSTRSDRYDLYHNSVDDIDLFRIENDYVNYTPNCYKCDTLPDKMYDLIIHGINKKYPGYYIFDPKKFACNRNMFNFQEMDFNYTPHEDNSKIIRKVVKENLNKKIITISSRHREDSKRTSKRNWGLNNWEELYNFLNITNKYLVFVAGVSPTYHKARSVYNNLINLEDYKSNVNLISDIGLTIEAIKQSDMVIGTQSAAILLSNLLKTPTFFWGDEIERHAVVENIFSTPCFYLEDLFYKSSSVDVYKKFEESIGLI